MRISFFSNAIQTSLFSFTRNVVQAKKNNLDASSISSTCLKEAIQSAIVGSSFFFFSSVAITRSRIAESIISFCFCEG